MGSSNSQPPKHARDAKSVGFSTAWEVPAHDAPVVWASQWSGIMPTSVLTFSKNMLCYQCASTLGRSRFIESLLKCSNFGHPLLKWSWIMYSLVMSCLWNIERHCYQGTLRNPRPDIQRPWEHVPSTLHVPHRWSPPANPTVLRAQKQSWAKIGYKKKGGPLYPIWLKIVRSLFQWDPPFPFKTY